MTTEQCKDMLLAAYQSEVEFRGRKFVDDGFAAKHSELVAEALVGVGGKFGVLMCGLCGNGKTTMLLAARSVCSYLADCGLIGREWSFPVLDAKEARHYAKDRAKFESIAAKECLGLEDIGREATEVLEYGNVLNPVIDLLEHRYRDRLFTMVTTNLTARDIRAKYGDRIADRFNEMMKVVVFKNPSYRGAIATP